DGVEESGLPLSTGRFWLRVRLFLLLETSPVRLFQDRWRLHSGLWRQYRRPTRCRGDRGDRQGYGEEDRSGIRHRSRHGGSPALRRHRLRAGLPYRRPPAHHRDLRKGERLAHATMVRYQERAAIVVKKL